VPRDNRGLWRHGRQHSSVPVHMPCGSAPSYTRAGLDANERVSSCLRAAKEARPGAEQAPRRVGGLRAGGQPAAGCSQPTPIL